MLQRLWRGPCNNNLCIRHAVTSTLHRASLAVVSVCRSSRNHARKAMAKHTITATLHRARSADTAVSRIGGSPAREVITIQKHIRLEIPWTEIYKTRNLDQKLIGLGIHRIRNTLGREHIGLGIYTRPETHQTRNTSDQGSIELEAHQIRNTLGQEYTRPEIHQAMNMSGQGYSGPETHQTGTNRARVIPSRNTSGC